MTAQKSWSQTYTCPNCNYQMTLEFDGNRYRIKARGDQGQKPNVRQTSTARNGVLRCPSCDQPLPSKYQR